MSGIFEKIVSREIPARIVAENDEFLAFLDILPVQIGHVLVIPKRKTDYIFDMDDNELSKLIVFSKKVAIGIKKVISCTKIGMSVVGLEVPHAHVHLIPINQVEDMNFKAERKKLSDAELDILADQIKSACNEQK